jgi:hypothetical protein
MDTMNLKMTERIRDKGKVYEGETFLLDVTYVLELYDEITTTRTYGETSKVEGNPTIIGTIKGRDIDDLIGREHLTLHLADGRYLNIIVINIRGGVQANGSFYQPEQ